MKTKFIIYLLIFCSSITQAQLTTDKSYIEVTGTSETDIIPNEIEITISVKEKEFKTPQAFTDFEKRMIAKIAETGVAVKEELSIMKMNNIVKVSILSGDNMVSSRQYVLVVHDAAKANEVFKAMDDIGITTIAVTRFNHTEIEKYRLQVKLSAIKAAQEKARALTNAIGQDIGKAFFIDEVNNESYSPNLYSNMVYKEKVISDRSEIESVNFQKIHMKYSVLVRFELK